MTAGDHRPMTKVLVLQSDVLSHAALVGDRLAERGIELAVRRCDLGEPISDADRAADGLLILGGPQSLLDDRHAGLTATMTRTVRAFHDADKPILGVCLGIQVIAKAFDAPVRRARELQFGFLPVRFRETAADDPLLRSHVPEKRVFCWHEDCADLPDGAVHLAETDDVPNYGFRLGRSTYGFQCHFEVTRDSLARMLERGSHFVPKNLGARGERMIAEIGDEIETHLDGATGFGRAVTDAWADLLFERAPKSQ